MEKRKVSKRRQTGTTAKDDIELFQSPPNSPLLTPKSSHLATSLEAPSQLQTPLSSPPTSRPPSPNPTDIPCLIPLPNSRPSTPSFRESQNDNICNNNNCSSSISNSNNFNNNNNSISVATIIARNNQEIIDDENTKKGSSTSSSNNRHHSNLHQHQNHNTNLHNSSYHSSPSSLISTSTSSSSSTPPPFTRCPPEIIYNIFEILCKMHQTTLFSCVLVDHQWNAIGTNVLWNSPRFTHMRSLDKFIKTIEYNNDNNNNSSSSSSSSPFKSSSSQLPIATASSPTSTSPSSPISQSTSSSSPISQSSSTSSSPISAKIYHPYASYIRTLDLTYLTEHDRNNSALSSHLLRLLPLIHMENLHTLNLSFVKGITNNYLTKLLSPFFNCIKTLNLAGGSRSDKCLSSIIPYCHQVQNLSLAWNTSLSDTSINKIATICGGSLRKLDLTNCEKVSDISLIYISQYCTKLRELKVSYCRGVSEEGIRAVIERCETLRVLDLVGCLNVDKYFLLKCNDEFGLGKCRDLKLIWRRLVENNVPPSSSPLPSSSSPSPSLSSLSPSSSSSLLSSTNATTFSILISLSTSPTSSSTSSSLWNDDNN